MTHDHDHNHNCGCHGHEHDHEHGHEHGHEHCGCRQHMPYLDENVALTAAETELLSLLGEFRYLPVTRFVLRSSADEQIQATALAPVTIETLSDSMDAVRARGARFQSLEDAGLITLDYDLPMTGFDYGGYRESELFRYFERTVQQGSRLPGAQFDIAALEEGSMALTELGERVLARINGTGVERAQ